MDGIEFLPVDKRRAYVPDAETVNKLIFQARSDKWLRRRFPDTADYIETLQDTLGRMSEVNRLEWKDVDLDQKLLVLYTRKIDGGLTPRDVPMTERLYHILLRRYAERDDAKPWVFWNPRTGKPYQDRKKFMRRLCEKAGVKYFRFHSLRHSSASLMDNNNVSKSVIQRILGHTNRTTTDLYLHSMGDSEKEAMLVLENARKKVTHKVTHKDEMIS